MRSDHPGGDWRLWSHDPETGVTRWYLDMGDRFVIRTDTPVDAILAANAEDMAASQGKRFGDGQVVARIPMTVYRKLGLMEAAANGDRKFAAKVLNDADYKRFRTFSGRI